MLSELNDDTLLLRDTEVVSSEIDDDTVLMSAAAGKYYSFNAIGTAVWRLLAQPATTRQICAALQGEFDVAPQQCEQEVRSFLQQLLADNLARVVTPDHT